MEKQSEADAVLIVMELGGRWPTCFYDLLRAAPHGVVLAQDPTETSEGLAGRLRRRLMQVAAAEQHLKAAVISAGAGSGPDVFVSRCLMVQALSRSLAPTNGRLILSGHAWLPDSARHEIARVAATMGEHVALQLDVTPSGIRKAVSRMPPPAALDRSTAHWVRA